mgnify:CR=1 FL=1
MIHGFLKACTVSPVLRVADCAFNTQQTIAAMRRAALDGAQLAVFPELGLTGYTCGDLFFQQPLQRAAAKGLAAVLEASAGLDLVALVGLPVAVDGKLYNCAAVVCHGKLLGLVPKTHLPNYGEFYEKRQFNPAPAGVRTLRFAGQEVPFGTQLLFRCAEMPEFCLAAEVCEDLWAPLPPSTHHALAGATVIANLSASDETIGKAAFCYDDSTLMNISARQLTSDDLVLALSISGETSLIIAAATVAKSRGAALVSFTNLGSNTLSGMADENLYVNATNFVCSGIQVQSRVQLLMLCEYLFFRYIETYGDEHQQSIG